MQNSTPIPVPTSTPSPAEVVERATQVIDAFQSLGPLMAVLGVTALALAFALAVAWFNRGTTSAAVAVLASANAEKIKELTISKEQLELERKQHSESMVILADQSVRSNDLFEALNNRGLERDKQQQRMVETQQKIAGHFESLLSEGSKPVQEIQTRVLEILQIATNLDSRTADWNGILTIITPLLVELGALRQEAKKHSTQPIPAVDPDPKPEASPS